MVLEKQELPFEYLLVNGAGGVGSALNGLYKREAKPHNRRVVYRKTEGEGLVYFDGLVWKMSRVNKLFWIYCAQGVNKDDPKERPPCSGWTQMAEVEPVWARTPGLAPTNLNYTDIRKGRSTEREHADPPPALDFKSEAQASEVGAAPRAKKEAAAREGSMLTPDQAKEAARRWMLFRQRHVVDNKAGRKLLELTVSRNGTELWGIERIVRKQTNGNPGLVVWEAIDKGILGDHNHTAAPHRVVRQFSVITMINGTCFTGEMISEIHTANKLIMTIRVPQTDKFEDLVQMQRIKIHIDKDAKNAKKAGDTADDDSDVGLSARAAEAADSSASVSFEKSEQEAAEGEDIARALKRSMKKRAVSMDKNRDDKHGFNEGEQTQIEDFLRDPESFAVLQHMMTDAADSGIHRAHSMQTFLGDIQNYHIQKMKDAGAGVFSSISNAGSAAGAAGAAVGGSAAAAGGSAATSSGMFGCCASARGGGPQKLSSSAK